ncbi:MAG: hypothetical protein IJJ00_02610 [Erysipelotrichaceae bacterium]|nr:hypothetical protein [Erysipelotrichaceae bacterium]
MKYGIMYGREIGPLKMYKEIPVKRGDYPEVYDTPEEAQARADDLSANNPIAHGTYRVCEISDEELAGYGL